MLQRTFLPKLHNHRGKPVVVVVVVVAAEIEVQAVPPDPTIQLGHPNRTAPSLVPTAMGIGITTRMYVHGMKDTTVAAVAEVTPMLWIMGDVRYEAM
jgi:hypothetical protein